jgi:hypothetical protein
MGRLIIRKQHARPQPDRRRDQAAAFGGEHDANRLTV